MSYRPPPPLYVRPLHPLYHQVSRIHQVPLSLHDRPRPVDTVSDRNGPCDMSSTKYEMLPMTKGAA